MLLSIEGPIGVGKTSLTNIIAENLRELNFIKIYELSQRNIYLDRFYIDVKRYAFPTQIEFLINRFWQWRKIQDLKGNVVCDYFFFKDEIFACMNLEGEDINLYRRIFNLMVHHIKPPDYLVYLTASPSTLLERIKRRGRTFEAMLKLDYLISLCKSYEDYISGYKVSPILKIETDSLDYVNRKEDQEYIMSKIKRFILLGGK
ncbi:MAG: deoxynucleoside kinase [bacterium]